MDIVEAHDLFSFIISVARALVITRGPCSDYISWVESAQKTAGSSTIVCDRKSEQDYLRIIASFELGTTRAIAKVATFFRLAADGLARTYQIEVPCLL